MLKPSDLPNGRQKGCANMKKKIVPILFGILALTMLSGCGAPQAQTEPTTVNQAMLIEKSSQPQETYSFPDRFTGDWTTQEGKLTIHADAPVVAEQGVALPTATVEPREFTQADVDNLLRVFLKGEALYSHVQTKDELQASLDHINSPEWQADPDSSAQTPEQLETRRKELNAWYTAEIAKAPNEKPIIHGFSDSNDPTRISGFATVNGLEYDISFDNGDWREANITRKDYKYNDWSESWGGISKEDAVAQADALIQDLGFGNMVLDDAQKWENGSWRLYYAPTVNGFSQSSIRKDTLEGDFRFYQYWDYKASDSENPDTVTWWKENIQIVMGKDGLLSFTWTAPTTIPVIKQEHTAILPFEEIASIANTMLPVVIVGPKDHSLVDLDRMNGFDTKMDVEITKVSLNLMRIRDKGSLQGTIVPVWDFWGTSSWYRADEQPQNYDTQPMLTLNAIDGTVVSRELGY